MALGNHGQYLEPHPGILRDNNDIEWPASGASLCWSQRSRKTSPLSVALECCEDRNTQEAPNGRHVLILLPWQMAAGPEAWLWFHARG